MFTGIVEELGRVRVIRRQGAVVCLCVLAKKVSEDAKIGDSISVNGACLTIVAAKDNLLSFDVMQETFSGTTLKDLRVQEEVNLERALKVGDRVGGHFVTGHVDCVGIIRSRAVVRGNLEYRIALPPRFLKDIVRKGSMAVDGISLTVADIKQGAFSVCIIPHTAGLTTLGKKYPGARVNIELDVLVKK
jgi:riboflavin synthase